LLLGCQLLFRRRARCIPKRWSWCIRVDLALEAPDLFAILLRLGARGAPGATIWILWHRVSALFVVEAAADAIAAT
jgi:hypothetical protein